MDTILHLTGGGASVVVDARQGLPPAIVYWGGALGEPGAAELEGIAAGSFRQRVSGGLDETARLSLLPVEADGWQGTPGLAGSRAGVAFSPQFAWTTEADDDGVVIFHGVDGLALLSVRLRIEVDASGVLTQQLVVVNDGDEPYQIEHAALTFPVPDTADELFSTYGRHLRERFPQRQPFTIGTFARESRRGRPGADNTLLLVAGATGFGFERGECFGAHLAWSGNHRYSAERTVGGAAFLQLSELLLPGEVVLAPGGSYITPPAHAAHGDGLSALSGRLHAFVRARPTHPRSPRPVTVNTWEAVYFDQDETALAELAARAAEVGVERFVLDDGWFLHRRSDTAGLGDWHVDETVWPHGLHPLIETVSGLGMEFGLWVEPEMVNEDSDLARAHPDWILSVRGRHPRTGRQQQVLDLSNPAAEAYILERLDDLLSRHDIRYLKWDHNRDLLDPAGTVTGTPAVRENVLALYRLIDTLRQRHPGVEIESCASGGARVDLGILARTDRVWTSDCIDPIERLTIQKYTGLLLPPELLGMHIGSPVAHSTGRATTLSLRASAALTGHLGVEWDLTGATVDEREELAAWIALHRENRTWIHRGAVVHADLPDSSMDLRGVVSADREHALYVFTQVTSSETYPSASIRFPGLDPDGVYRLRGVGPSAAQWTPGQSELPWEHQELRLPGRYLAERGLPAPVLWPAQSVVYEVTRD